MITAVDTNIFLDILIPDENYYFNSKKLLDEHVERGQLIISEIVYAELASLFSSEKEMRAFLSDTGTKLTQSSEKALCIAGNRWNEYAKDKKRSLQCPRCGKGITVTCQHCHSSITFRQRILSDFIIGAHALVHADLLLSRDRGFYKTYFKDLSIG